MGLLPRLRIVVDGSDMGIEPEISAMMKKKKEKTDQPPRYFSMKERLLIFIILGVTILGGVLFWLGGGGKVSVNSSLNTSTEDNVSSSDPIIPHPQNDNGFFDWGFNQHITIEK